LEIFKFWVVLPLVPDASVAFSLCLTFFLHIETRVLFYVEQQLLQVQLEQVLQRQEDNLVQGLRPLEVPD
jgi:hypothetical protein